MVSTRNRSTYITPAAYLAMEEVAEEKHEYFDGVVTLMAGGTENHNSIALDVTSNLRIGLRGSTCRAFGSETRLLVKDNGLFTYPDAMVVCGEIERTDDNQETVTNPTVIIEVLSPSTEGYDRGLKFERYREIPTFREYLLIHQNRPFIEHYLKGADHVWTVRFIHGLENTLVLQTIDYALPLRLIYEYVEITPPTFSSSPNSPQNSQQSPL